MLGFSHWRCSRPSTHALQKEVTVLSASFKSEENPSTSGRAEYSLYVPQSRPLCMEATPPATASILTYWKKVFLPALVKKKEPWRTGCTKLQLLKQPPATPTHPRLSRHSPCYA